jgi:hypothetical protein
MHRGFYSNGGAGFRDSSHPGLVCASRYAGIPRLTFQKCYNAEGREGLIIVKAYLEWPADVENDQNKPYREDKPVWELKRIFHERILFEQMN